MTRVLFQGKRLLMPKNLGSCGFFPAALRPLSGSRGGRGGSCSALIRRVRR